MALRMYTSRDLVPGALKIIDRNDSHFILNSVILEDTEIGRKILQYVETGEYVSTKSFIGQFSDSVISSIYLSTGSKTLFNILDDVNGEYCFNTVECGKNAVQFILDNMNGCILIVPSLLLHIDDSSREYYLNNEYIRNNDDFVEVMRRVIGK